MWKERKVDAVSMMKAIKERLDNSLVALIEGQQDANPGYLLARSPLARIIAETVGVSRQAVFKHLTEAVADGRLIELRPRSDWQMELPGGDDLPPLYPVPGESRSGVYRLQYARPQSRGAGQISFLSTPGGLESMLPLVRKQLGLPEPPHDGMQYYKPLGERSVRPGMYGQLKKALIETSPSPLCASEAGDMLDAVLSVLKLKPPAIQSAYRGRMSCEEKDGMA
jgi:hypothetical protein